MQHEIPLLTDIIETGDETKAGLYRHAEHISADADDPQIINDTFDFNMDDEEDDIISSDELSLHIQQAIDAVIPDIKQQLHDQLLAQLTKL
jgi:hypothetical protein